MDSLWGRDQWLGREPAEWPSFPGQYGMADDDKPRQGRGRRSRPGQRSAKAPAERPFDMWLQKQLHAMYDEIAGEPLPDDLLDLIDQRRRRDRTRQKGEPGQEDSPRGTFAGVRPLSGSHQTEASSC